MHAAAARKFITFVGDPLQCHPSFKQAYNAGFNSSWVRDAGELRGDLSRVPFTDLIIFDTRYQSNEQCSLCRQLRAQGHRVVCIGCTAEECAPWAIRETDLLSAIFVTFAFDLPAAPAFQQSADAAIPGD
jgi:hypothetical protein